MKLPSWLNIHLPLWLKITLLVVLLAGTAALGYAGYKLRTKQYDNIPLNVAQLKIESDPAGASIVGDPDCDSTKLTKTTPYTCNKVNADLSTTITAPNEFTKDGQTYQFKTWDGCSESNPDKKICKIAVKQGERKTAKASYEKGGAASTGRNTNTNAQPNQPPVCVPNDPNDGNFASCRFTITNTPTSITIRGDMEATSCGKYIMARNGSRVLAPCGGHPQLFFLGAPQRAFDVACTTAGACSVDWSDALATTKVISVNKPTELLLKAPLQAVHEYNCNVHSTCYADTTFSSWVSNSQSVLMHYLFPGLD